MILRKSMLLYKLSTLGILNFYDIFTEIEKTH